MSETRTITQYPGGEPLVLTAPMNEPVAIDALINNSNAMAGVQTTLTSLQTQITSLAARVTALENAAASEASGTSSTPAA